VSVGIIRISAENLASNIYRLKINQYATVHKIYEEGSQGPFFYGVVCPVWVIIMAESPERTLIVGSISH
jgi:hypothetical protein